MNINCMYLLYIYTICEDFTVNPLYIHIYIYFISKIIDTLVSALNLRRLSYFYCRNCKYFARYIHYTKIYAMNPNMG